MSLVAQALSLTIASALAGAVNSVAGGGSLLSFPAAIAFGLDPLVANATNAVALTPGSIASAVGYRQEIARDERILRLFLPPALVGGILGSILLLVTPAKVFDQLVPLLVLFATLLLLRQNLRKKPKEDEAMTGEWVLPNGTRSAVALQFLVGVYGGYFGAGMGIMMLAILDKVGGKDIHRMNGVKSVLGAAINAVAAVLFVLAKAVDYRASLIMAVGAIAGGFVGSAVARKVKPPVVRWVVVAIGLFLTAGLAYKRL